MISEKLLLSSAYFPPVNYFSLIAAAKEVLIEKEENYVKQTYRNRCRIFSANGPMQLSIPVFEGSFHKKSFSEIRIDHTKRWKQVHLRSIESSYRSAPYFEYYFDRISEVISADNEFLLDLNLSSIRASLDIAGISTPVKYTDSFEKPDGSMYDFRYRISPKKAAEADIFCFHQYQQVFSGRFGFVPALSILDLIFNMGPDSHDIVRKSINKSAFK